MVLMLSAGLAGDARGEMGYLSAEDAVKEDAANDLLARLRKPFKMDGRAELAGDLEEYLCKLQRCKSEALFASD